MMISFATGIMNAVTFSDYHLFAFNQTGNTALLAVGALGIEGGMGKLQHVGLSLETFVAGGLMCCQLWNSIGCMSRVWLLTTNVFQTALVLAAAALHTHTDHVKDESINLGIITLLAFASGAQVASAWTVQVPEIMTTMVTSVYIDFLVDPHIFKKHNRVRNRRLFFIGSLVLGSFIGAIAYKFFSPAFGLYLSAAGKALVSSALLFNPRREP